MKETGLREHFSAFKVEIALKIVITGIICILINNIFHLDIGYFSALFVFLLLVLHHGEVFKVGVETLIGCVISGLVSLLITYFLIDSKIVYVLVMSLWIFIVVASLVRQFLTMLISGVAATMVMYNSIYGSVSYTTNLFENYVLQLLISIVIASLIDGVFWPHKTRPVFQMTLRTIYEEFSALFESFTQEKIEDRKSHLNISTSLSTFSNLVIYVNRMEREEGDKDFPIDLYMKIITFSRGIFIKTEVLEEFILREHEFTKDERVAGNLNKILLIISESFKELAESVGTNNIVKIESDELDQAISSFHAVYKEMHEVVGKDDAYYEDLLAFGAMLPVIDEISMKMKKITEAINIFHRGDYRRFLGERVTRTKEVEKIKSKYFLSITKESSIAGFKTVVIFLLLMFGEVVFGLPGGGQVVFFAIVFGIIPNLGQAYMKSKYGLVGVLCGLVFSFISLIIVINIPHFLIVVCLYSLGTFVAAYIASSSKDIAAVGLQAGLLFPFGILITTGPDIDINEAITRFLALISAVIIGLIVQHTLWPVNPYKALLNKISKSIAYSGQIISKLLSPEIKDREKLDASVLPIAATLPTSTSLLHDAEYIIRENELHAEAFIKIIESIELIYAALETIKRTLLEYSDSGLIDFYLKSMEPKYLKMAKLFEEVAHQFDGKTTYTGQILSLKDEIEIQINKNRESGEWREYDPGEVEKLVLIHSSVNSLLDSLYNISSSINTITGLENGQEKSLHPSESTS